MSCLIFETYLLQLLPLSSYMYQKEERAGIAFVTIDCLVAKSAPSQVCHRDASTFEEHSMDHAATSGSAPYIGHYLDRYYAKSLAPGTCASQPEEAPLHLSLRSCTCRHQRCLL